MSPKTPYLIQRGEFKSYDGYPRLSKAVYLDYMGSAEFEFDALPKSLRELEQLRDQLSIIYVAEINIQKKGSSKNIPLKVLSPWKDGSEEWSWYKEKLLSLRADELRTKENTGFALNSGRWYKADFWWDIENHVMFSFRQHFAHDILHLLDSSWKYMNEKAEERNACNNLIAGTS